MQGAREGASPHSHAGMLLMCSLLKGCQLPALAGCTCLWATTAVHRPLWYPAPTCGVHGARLCAAQASRRCQRLRPRPRWTMSWRW